VDRPRLRHRQPPLPLRSGAVARTPGQPLPSPSLPNTRTPARTARQVPPPVGLTAPRAAAAPPPARPRRPRPHRRPPSPAASSRPPAAPVRSPPSPPPSPRRHRQSAASAPPACGPARPERHRGAFGSAPSRPPGPPAPGRKTGKSSRRAWACCPPSGMFLSSPTAPQQERQRKQCPAHRTRATASATQHLRTEPSTRRRLGPPAFQPARRRRGSTPRRRRLPRQHPVPTQRVGRPNTELGRARCTPAVDAARRPNHLAPTPRLGYS